MAGDWRKPKGGTIGPEGEEIGYWPSQWAEFKRRFLRTFWHDMSSRVTLILMPVAMVVVLVGEQVFGWW